MVTVELHYECITRSFRINECLITDLFSGDIVNFVKCPHPTSPDMRLVNEELYAVQPVKKESVLNAVADGPQPVTKSYCASPKFWLAIWLRISGDSLGMQIRILKRKGSMIYGIQ
ncbi:hypothetical protein TNCV_1656381 [Trichonephila clavipes]|nr:hypothetical protein TNCV_1656381 [Trichonephila clavipes]